MTPWATEHHRDQPGGSARYVADPASCRWNEPNPRALVIAGLGSWAHTWKRNNPISQQSVQAPEESREQGGRQRVGPGQAVSLASRWNMGLLSNRHPTSHLAGALCCTGLPPDHSPWAQW